jgi:phage shock protein E
MSATRRHASVHALLAAALTAAGLAACATAPRAAPAAWPPSGKVTGAQARALVLQGAILVDVRDHDDWSFEHIEGAVNVPVDQLEARRDEVGPTSLPVVVYCNVGKKSGEATTTLTRLGYLHVYDLGARSNWSQ